MKDILLSHPYHQQPFIVFTDSSDVRLGAQLCQESQEGLKTIEFASRSLLMAETNYTTMEKELLAIVFVLNKFGIYLIEKNSVIRCDHRTLTFLHHSRMLSPCLTRCVLLLQAFDYTIKYIPGRDNTTADALPRGEPPTPGRGEAFIGTFATAQRYGLGENFEYWGTGKNRMNCVENFGFGSNREDNY